MIGRPHRSANSIPRVTRRREVSGRSLGQDYWSEYRKVRRSAPRRHLVASTLGHIDGILRKQDDPACLVVILGVASVFSDLEKEPPAANYIHK